MEWKVLESEYLYNEPWLTIRKEKCELPNGKLMPAYYTLEYPSWVSAFALTDEGKVVMVRQYRHGLGVVSTELPGGVVDKGESVETAIARELKEETGYEFESFEKLGTISANPATSNNYMHMFLAKGGKKVSDQSLDETEDVEVLFHSIDEVKQLLRENKIIQALHVTTILYALNRLGDVQL
ncbi:MAG TPA: NUDIX hydrolase [Flavisolibacter sp.]|jgi:8-oxo-dGTP pyrophosphatase MutT (NUDIX family)|nr:NUDIX hydrolase [Flavisolibacter sp.]